MRHDRAHGFSNHPFHLSLLSRSNRASLVLRGLLRPGDPISRPTGARSRGYRVRLAQTLSGPRLLPYGFQYSPPRLSVRKMPSGANAFEISDIQEERNREPALTKRELAMLHCIGNLPRYQFARDTGGSAQMQKPSGRRKKNRLAIQRPSRGRVGVFDGRRLLVRWCPLDFPYSRWRWPTERCVLFRQNQAGRRCNRKLRRGEQ